MSTLQLHPDTAETRAALLAEAIRHAACLEGDITATTLSTHLTAWSGLSEEDVGLDVMSTVFFLMVSGLFRTNTYDAATDSFALAHNTTLTASHKLITFIHGEMGMGDVDFAV